MNRYYNAAHPATHNARFQAPLEAGRLQTLVGQAALPVPSRIGWFAGILDLTNVASSIGLRPVQIGEAIHLCELATR